MTRSKLSSLPTLLLPFLALACSSSVEVASGTGGGGTASTGAGGVSSATSSSASTSSASTSSSSTAAGSSTTGGGGAGGGSACQGFIEVAEDHGPSTSLSASCPGGWGSNVSAAPVGYTEAGGPAGFPARLVIAGCASTGMGRLEMYADFPGSDPGILLGTYTTGRVTYTDASGASYDTSIGPFELVVNQIEQAPEALYYGLFAVEVGNGGDTLAHGLTGTFQVCVVPDEDFD
jgi:hypothetical protein